MPTFQSIPIHASVRSRLSETNSINDGDSQKLVRSGVSTPRSLLTRDPKDLVEVFSKGEIRNEQQRAGILAQMEGIRSEVAHSMIVKTRNGKRVLNHQKQQQHNNYHHQGGLIQGGSLSALQTWNLHQNTISTNPHVYSTGCRALDELIAFPIEYFSHYDPSIIYSEDSNRETTMGLHRGYILQLSGATGKTQLALQLAAQVIQQSSSALNNDDRVRYCYSTAGHSGSSLAQRFLELLGNGGSERRLVEDVTKKIEFQPIATISQLITTLAKLEEEWMYHSSVSSSGSIRQHQQQRSEIKEKGPVAMLVLDALPLMLVERESIDLSQSLERWLKRIARHHNVLIVTTGGGASNNNSMNPDIALHIQKLTSTTSYVRLIRHPSKISTENDVITLLHSSKFGMTTPE
jgi:hypothetical protein